MTAVASGNGLPSREEVEEFVSFAKRENIAYYWTTGLTKVCNTPGWPDRATVPVEIGSATGEFVERLKSRNPIIPARKSRLFTIDCDTPENIAELQALGLPATWEVESGRVGDGGLHLYFRVPNGYEGIGLVWKDEAARWVLNRNPYLVGPMALHASGKRYRVVEYRPVPELSRDEYAALVALGGETVGAESGTVTPPDSRASRHKPLLSFVVESVKAGDQDDVILGRGIRIAADLPLKGRPVDKEITDLIAWARQKDAVPERGKQRHLKLIPLSEVEEKAARFFDRPLLQRGSFHILSARKGGGKGTYLADVAARVSRGELGDKRNVIWISSEDSNAQDVKPRVSVAGGVVENIHVVQSGWLELPRDLEEIRELVTEVGDVALMIIDPVSNHIAGKDSDAETAIREAIGPLNALADDLDTVVVGIRHLTEKAGKTEVLGAILGSSAWVQVPRVVVGIIEDNEDDSLRHIRVFRGNRVPQSEASLLFRIVGVPRPPHEMDIPKVEWRGQSSKDLDSLFSGGRGQSKTAAARDAIMSRLADSPGGIESDALDEAVASKTGITAKTVRNLRGRMAAEELIRSTPEKDDRGQVTAWIVSLTSKGCRALVLPEPEASEEVA